MGCTYRHLLEPDPGRGCRNGRLRGAVEDRREHKDTDAQDRETDEEVHKHEQEPFPVALRNVAVDVHRFWRGDESRRHQVGGEGIECQNRSVQCNKKGDAGDPRRPSHPLPQRPEEERGAEREEEYHAGGGKERPENPRMPDRGARVVDDEDT